MQLGCVNKMLNQMIALLVSMIPKFYSHNFIQFKKKQLLGMIIACYIIQTAQYLASWKIPIVSSRVGIMQQMWISLIKF